MRPTYVKVRIEGRKTLLAGGPRGGNNAGMTIDLYVNDRGSSRRLVNLYTDVIHGKIHIWAYVEETERTPMRELFHGVFDPKGE